MRIHSLSKLLAIPIGAILAAILYAGLELDYDNVVYLAMLPLILFTGLLVFHGQIDYWWRARNPVELDQPIVDWLMKFDPYYKSLDDETRKKFDNRMVMYMDGRDFTSMGEKTHGVPNDIQGIISANAVKMMMGKKDLLIGDMDRIVLYKHPFPTPRYPTLHTVETDYVDGVYIFSLEHVIAGMIDPTNYYNVAMHGYAEAYQFVYQKEDFDYLNEISWEQLEAISTLSKAQILKQMGYSDAYLTTVSINYYFTFPEKFKAELPEYYQRLEAQFGHPLLK